MNAFDTRQTLRPSCPADHPSDSGRKNSLHYGPSTYQRRSGARGHDRNTIFLRCNRWRVPPGASFRYLQMLCLFWCGWVLFYFSSYNNGYVAEARRPWSRVFHAGTANTQHPQRKPSFLSKLTTQVAFGWNSTGAQSSTALTSWSSFLTEKNVTDMDSARACQQQEEGGDNYNDDDDAKVQTQRTSLRRVLASTRNNSLTNALAEQIRSSLPESFKEFWQRNTNNTTGSFDWMGALADKLLSEESATAVKTIRTILASMEDHGIVDVFSKWPAQDVAASIYALYKLQRASYRYQTLHADNRHPPDLMHVLEDLSHYVVYATAAYGWKMDLAFKGKLHLGDEQALRKKTGIERDDIIKLSLKSKAHLPVFFLVRDRQRKTLVLCVRGTWSARDVLTDLCCTAEEYESPTIPQKATREPQPRRYCAHHGMLEAAMAVAIEMEELIEEELIANPDYSLVLCGHSMGGGVVSLLATFWETKFRNTKTFVFGGPCVAPMDSRPTNNTAIINVISEGDPFRCLSLGHIADVSAAVARLCEEPALRRTILTRLDGNIDHLEIDDLKWCWETMESIRTEVMTNDNKMVPPGRLFYVSRREFVSTDNELEMENDGPPLSDDIAIHEVQPGFFHELAIGPRMFDISRHLPSLYEKILCDLIESEGPR